MKYLLLTILFFCSCINEKSSQQLVNREVIPQSTLFANWKKDSTGCLGFRTMQCTEQVIRYFDSVSIADHISIPDSLGKPDVENVEMNARTYRYTIKNPCDSAHRPALTDSDACWLYITVDHQRISCSRVCI